MKAAAAKTRGRCFGFDLESDLALSFPLPPAGGATALRVMRGSPVSPRERAAETVLYRSPVPLPNGEPRLTLAEAAGELHFRLGEDLELALGAEHIEYRPAGPEVSWMVEPVLLTTGFSLWLERRGILALHASAVEIEGQGVAFLAASSGGKSTLAASWVAGGSALVTDDVLALAETPVGPRVLPSFPLVKLTPESSRLFSDRTLPPLVESFPGTAKNALIVGGAGVGDFASQPLPLAALYLLERGSEDAPVELEAVTPRDALVALLRQSFAPRLVAALGLAPQRLDRLARWLGTVPVRRLVYPTGFAQLARVRAAVMADLVAHRNIDL